MEWSEHDADPIEEAGLYGAAGPQERAQGYEKHGTSKF